MDKKEETKKEDKEINETKTSKPPKELTKKEKRRIEREKNKEKIIKFLEDSMGNIGVACIKIGISRKTFYNWKDKDEEFRKKAEEVLDEQKGEMDDYAEGKLFQHIKNNNIASLIFYLKTRHPNYGTKIRLEGGLKIERRLSKDEKALLRRAIKYALKGTTKEKEKDTPKGTEEKDNGEPDIQKESGSE